MAREVNLHSIEELDNGKGEILLGTNINTELHIIQKHATTIIKFPFGNKFDIIDGMIIVSDLPNHPH